MEKTDEVIESVLGWWNADMDQIFLHEMDGEYEFSQSYTIVSHTLNNLYRRILGIMNGFVLKLGNLIYSKIVQKYIDSENHRYDGKFKESYVIKIFVF